MPRWRPFEPYFWSLVHKTASCWIWLGNVDSKGYGRVHYKGKRCRAHRVSVELVTGNPIPADVLGCHSCDNKLCVNPDHIFQGTHKDNMRDWTDKGYNKLINEPSLWRRGDKHWTRQKTNKSKDGLRAIARLRQEEWKSGRRIAIRDSKGRIMGTRMASK